MKICVQYSNIETFQAKIDIFFHQLAAKRHVSV